MTALPTAHLEPTGVVRRSRHRRPIPHLRAPLASRVGCPAQAYVSELHRTCGGHVHAGWFCLFVRGARAYPVEELQDVVYHECAGCSGDHREGGA